ncbi:hypothetical protein FACS1894163_00840 [Spirochaetia bacterium]|nr:hypothetical protein FACS1894163_00840 [Spirochaetia bacterium]
MEVILSRRLNEKRLIYAPPRLCSGVDRKGKEQKGKDEAKGRNSPSMTAHLKISV